jgi:polyhydroxyalkanoate synthase
MSDQNNNWTQMWDQWQNTMTQAWQSWAQSFSGGATGWGVPGAWQGAAMPNLGGAMPDATQWLKGITGQAVSIKPDRLLQIQKDYAEQAAELWNSGLKPEPPKDRRFAGEAWAGNPMSSYVAASYLLNAKTLLALADAVEADAKTRQRVMFSVQQWVDATAPSNFLAFNAEALKKAVDTQGESLMQGARNLVNDMQRGHVSMTDEEAFEVGKNVATSEGAVVFENDLFQLIEYKPLTKQVYERPFLLVPPCINKFYILDLQPENSFIRYAVENGHRTFVVSWRNPDESLRDVTWDDYVEQGAIQAIAAVQDITRAETINALGFCVGGTIVGTALAVLAARGEYPVNSVTFLTTLLDFSDTGILDVFIDENFVKFREMQFANGGIMPGQDLATTFSFLRPNDLVWNYVVGNYLKGESPPPFDLLYWNSDSTNLPGPMYAWYLRNTYLENRLVQPGAATVCGESIDFDLVDVPAYIYGSREDHIVPIAGAYGTTQFWAGEKRFVMGASGHIAGVINPASKGKRSHWIGADDDFPADVNDWIAEATEHKGSWWGDWSAWLGEHGGKKIAAPKTYGRARTAYKALEAAPGSYVKAKA